MELLSLLVLAGLRAVYETSPEGQGVFVSNHAGGELQRGVNHEVAQRTIPVWFERAFEFVSRRFQRRDFVRQVTIPSVSVLADADVSRVEDWVQIVRQVTESRLDRFGSAASSLRVGSSSYPSLSIEAAFTSTTALLLRVVIGFLGRATNTENERLHMTDTAICGGECLELGT
jgi:hypothetical protein